MDSVIKLGPQKRFKTLVRGGDSPRPQLQGVQTIHASGPIWTPSDSKDIFLQDSAGLYCELLMGKLEVI